MWWVYTDISSDWNHPCPPEDAWSLSTKSRARAKLLFAVRLFEQHRLPLPTRSDLTCASYYLSMTI